MGVFTWDGPAEVVGKRFGSWIIKTLIQVMSLFPEKTHNFTDHLRRFRHCPFLPGLFMQPRLRILARSKTSAFKVPASSWLSSLQAEVGCAG